MFSMTNDQHEIRRKFRVLQHAKETGDVSKTCRHFGIGRASFYRWRQAYADRGEAGLANARSVPHHHPNKIPAEVVEKVIHLRRKYHLGLNSP
jgi:transposase-like protein